VGDRHNTYTNNIMKNRLCEREVINKRGKIKKEVKKVNMVDILPTQE
jgi:hypothetical protein